MSRQLKLKINTTSYSQILASIENAIRNNIQITINYLNFHSINCLLQDGEFFQAINSSDIVFPDGTGIWLASKLHSAKSWERFNFTDSGFRFLADCERNNWNLFFIGSNNNTIDKMLISIYKKLPRLKIVGTHNGYDNLYSDELFNDINNKSPHILFVGMGTPKQEVWIHKNRNRISAPVIFSVGDLFNLYAGTKTRGPKIARVLGLEWMFRIFSNPKSYFKRYVKGIPQFTWNLINNNFIFSDKV